MVCAALYRLSKQNQKILILNAYPQNLSERKQKKQATLVTSIDGMWKAQGYEGRETNIYVLEPSEFYTR